MLANKEALKRNSILVQLELLSLQINNFKVPDFFSFLLLVVFFCISFVKFSFEQFKTRLS